MVPEPPQQNALEVFGEDSGAAVMMDCRSGDVLCMLSAPSFDANQFVKGMTGPDYRALAAYDRKPLFDKALSAIKEQGLGAAGLVATNSIRGGASRTVLEAINRDSRIFDAWSDEPWVNDGAAVRVSLVCFGGGEGARLGGHVVPQIYADLTAPSEAGDSLDVSQAVRLTANLGASFQGASKKAKFEIEATLAREWLRLPNPNGRPNSDVVKPWANFHESRATHP